MDLTTLQAMMVEVRLQGVHVHKGAALVCAASWEVAVQQHTQSELLAAHPPTQCADRAQAQAGHTAQAGRVQAVCL